MLDGAAAPAPNAARPRPRRPERRPGRAGVARRRPPHLRETRLAQLAERAVDERARGTSGRGRSSRTGSAPGRPPTRGPAPRRAGRAPPIRGATARCVADDPSAASYAIRSVGSQRMSTAVVGSPPAVNRRRFLTRAPPASRRPSLGGPLAGLGGRRDRGRSRVRELRRLRGAPAEGLLREGDRRRRSSAVGRASVLRQGRLAADEAREGAERDARRRRRHGAARGGLRVRLAAAHVRDAPATVTNRARRAPSAARLVPDGRSVGVRRSTTGSCSRASREHRPADRRAGGARRPRGRGAVPRGDDVETASAALEPYLG